MNSTTKWLLGALALIAAALAGNLASRLHQPDDGVAKELASQRALLSALAKKLDAASPARAIPPSPTIVGAACDPVAIQAQVESSVRDALAADRAELDEQAKDRGVSPDNAAIYAKADEWLSSKLETKRWQPSDFAQLARASIGLSAEQRSELRRRVLLAVNSGGFEAIRRE